MRVVPKSTTLTLSGGTIVDGSGGPGFTGNLTMDSGVITGVGGRDTQGEVLDVTGYVVTPGFVDIHSHADWLLGYQAGHALLATNLEQGITTAVVGNCHSSPAPVVGDTEKSQVDRQPLADSDSDQLPWTWRSFGDYLDWLAAQGVPINCAFLVGHGIVRCGVMRTRLRSPRVARIEMQRLVGSSIDQGAFGLSVGLGYFQARYAPPWESPRSPSLPAKRARWSLPTQGASPACSTMPWTRSLGSPGSRSADFDHQCNPMGQLNWSGFGRLQDRVRAAGAGTDVGFDTVAYVAWSTDVVGLLPHPLATEGSAALIALAATKGGRAYLRDELARQVPSWPAWRPGSVTRSLPTEVGWENLRIAFAGSPRFEPYTRSSIDEIALRDQATLSTATATGWSTPPEPAGH